MSELDELVKRSHAASRRGDSQAAISITRQATEIFSDNYLAWLIYGHHLRAARFDDEAERVLRRAIHMEPDMRFTWSELGHLRDDQNRLGDALNAFEKAIALDPTYSICTIAADLAFRLGQRDRAIELAERALSLKPGWEEGEAVLERVRLADEDSC